MITRLIQRLVCLIQTDVLGLNCRIIGGIVHGCPDKFYAFLVTHFNKETNTLLECFRRILDSLPTIPPKIIVQLDNTSQVGRLAMRQSG